MYVSGCDSTDNFMQTIWFLKHTHLVYFREDFSCAEYKIYVQLLDLFLYLYIFGFILIVAQKLNCVVPKIIF